MRKRLLFLSAFFLIFHLLNAQRRYGVIEKSNVSTGTIIFSLGSEFCFADTKNSPFTQNLLKNNDLSVGFRVSFPSNFRYKTQINYSNFTGSDGSDGNRTYSFSSKVGQLSFQGEYAFNFGKSQGHSSPPNSLYFFVGVGLLESSANLNFIPKENYSYKTRQDHQIDVSVFIPTGFGYEYNFNNKFLMGLEYNFRYPFSDYIDGFKPPYPISKYNDILEGLSLTIGYRIY